MVLGQYRVVRFGTWWYWVTRRRYWLVPGGTGSALQLININQQRNELLNVEQGIFGVLETDMSKKRYWYIKYIGSEFDFRTIWAPHNCQIFALFNAFTAPPKNIPNIKYQK